MSTVNKGNSARRTVLQLGFGLLLLWPLQALADKGADRARVIYDLTKLPLSFEANQGQTDMRVKFLSHGNGYALFLAPTEAVLSLRRPRASGENATPSAALSPTKKRSIKTEAAEYAVLHLKLDGANPHPQISGANQLPGTVNYFIGKDPKKWRTNVPTYAEVKYESVYPGIGLLYHGSNQRQLEYDFVVAPEADPSVIRFRFAGADQLTLNAEGDLVVRTPGGEVIEHAPQVYQEIGGQQRAVGSNYVLLGKDEVGLKTAAYDRSRRLLIDPVLTYSTYLGSTVFRAGLDVIAAGTAITADASGNAYITGRTNSADFPTTPGAFQTSLIGSEAAFVAKLNAAGTTPIYSTYLGGSRSGDQGNAIAIDASGNAYVTGQTASSDFPVTPGAFQTSLRGVIAAFVTKLNAAGSALVYSTYLGGSEPDSASGIAIDSSGHAYVTGRSFSSDFPTTPGAFQTSCALSPPPSSCDDAFVAKLNSAGSALLYSTFLGGSGEELDTRISIDSSGNAYVMGETSSSDFPLTPGAFQTVCKNCTPGLDSTFVTKLNADGSAPLYSTLLGGSAPNFSRGITVDANGDAYVTAFTFSSDFPTTQGAFQTTCAASPLAPCDDAFVTKLNATGAALLYSTFLGGSLVDSVLSIAADATGHAYVTGSTGSPDFPTTPDAFQPTCASCTPVPTFDDAFVTKLKADGSGLVYSTFLGGSGDDFGSGIAIDAMGHVYVTGSTSSTNFPVSAAAFQTSIKAPQAGFVSKFTFCPQPKSKSECKNGGWRNFCEPSFKNQGQCIAFVNHQR